MPIPHSAEWYDLIATQQQGYFYPWSSTVGEPNGETLYLPLVREHLTAESMVLDCGCGHGEDALALAPACGHVTGYDRCASFLELARRAAMDRGIRNTTFIHHDSSSRANAGRGRIPAEDGEFDLIISRKGPLSWIEDATRVARQNAVLLMLVPDATPRTCWTDELPLPLRWDAPADPNWCRSAIESRLAVSGLEIDSWWSSEVPEYFPDAWQLYTWHSWGRDASEVPPFSEVRTTLERVFDKHATSQGLRVSLRHVIWKAVVGAMRS